MCGGKFPDFLGDHGGSNQLYDRGVENGQVEEKVAIDSFGIIRAKRNTDPDGEEDGIDRGGQDW